MKINNTFLLKTCKSFLIYLGIGYWILSWVILTLARTFTVIIVVINLIIRAFDCWEIESLKARLKMLDYLIRHPWLRKLFLQSSGIVVKVIYVWGVGSFIFTSCLLFILSESLSFERSNDIFGYFVLDKLLIWFLKGNFRYTHCRARNSCYLTAEIFQVFL
jgi:hypothetical protein